MRSDFCSRRDHQLSKLDELMNDPNRQMIYLTLFSHELKKRQRDYPTLSFKALYTVDSSKNLVRYQVTRKP